jgi:hypothetical protein
LAGRSGRSRPRHRAGREALLLQHRFQRVVDLGSAAQRLRNVGAPIGAIMNS